MSDLVRVLFTLVLSTSLWTTTLRADDLVTHEVDESVVHSILHGIHEDAEAVDPNASFLSEVASKFDFAGFARQMVRSYLVHRESNETHALNVVFLLGASHTIETSSGPLYFLVGIINGHAYEVLIPTTTALLSQALPGIDFMCFVLGGTYAASEDFRDLTTQGRIHLVKGARATGRFFGMHEFWSALVRREPALQYLSSRWLDVPTRVDLAPDYVRPEGRYARRGVALERLRHSRQLRLAESVSVTEDETGRARIDLLNQQGEIVGTLRGTEAATGNFIVDSLDLHTAKLKATSFAERDRWGSQLGWNVRDVLASVHRRLEKSPASELAAIPYIERVEKLDGNRVEVFSKAAPAPHSDCGSGHCHHDHKVGIASQHLHLLIAPAESEPDLSIRFVRFAIQISKHTEYRKWNALKSIPGLALGATVRTVRQIILSPVWATKALLKTPAFTWKVLLQTPAAVAKTARILSQITLNSGRGAYSVGETLVRAARATPRLVVAGARLSVGIARQTPAALAAGIRRTPAVLNGGRELAARGVRTGLRQTRNAVRVSVAACAWKFARLQRRLTPATVASR